ncbi:MAG: helix-turn-helix domain-containing protein [Bradyrhizobium sp.]|uniref:helix-turn-helix domain-containing protein n=1 Tax=Bradyrhizobium sp. TaxID=376 RepID=UPI003D09B8F3
MSEGKAPYLKFGTLLSQSRLSAGIAQQSGLAQKLNVAQQTVSRWERGVSRPRADQIPGLAAILEMPPHDLLSAAGYSPKSATAAFDQPFPVDALSPESFERLVEYFLAKRYRDATVHRAGGHGHSQDGIDIDVRWPNGVVHTFQCKRVEQFGPDKVHSAVAKHKRKAKKSFLVLSRIATPQARLAINSHAGWDIWDKEDISRQIRELPMDEQRRLVDIFFRGQRLALIGETEPGPWQTVEEFFAPFMNRQGAFNHTWDLVGRDKDLTQIGKAIEDDCVAVVNLVGAGGAGKTRILKDAIDKYQRRHPGTLVRLLSPTEQPTRQSLDSLGAGPKLLVVDDAHERDIDLLFHFVADRRHNARLLIALRPYGMALLQQRAAQFALIGDVIANISLKPLTKVQAAALARHVLQERNGPVGAAEDIATLTLDCPLATVMGAHIVAKERQHYELAKNEAEFRDTLMKSFYKVAAGSIGAAIDQERIKHLLRILALLQPFTPDDPALLEAVGKIEQLPSHDTSRLIRLLNEGGVLFKRGGQYRLSPDLLADYLIEEVCIGHDGGSTGYAERALEAVDGAHLEHLVVNLGKLDWRRSNGNPSNSRLLDGVWSKLNPTGEYGDAHLKAVTAVANFQPDRALAFVERRIEEGEMPNSLPPILKYIAYSISHAPAAVACLWELGKYDGREINQHPDHAIRILKELCQVAMNKPREYIEVAVDFGLSLLGLPDSWTHKYSPLDFLSGILEPDGHETSSSGRTITWTKFAVSHAFAAPLRAKVISAIISLLADANVKAAFRAAKHISEAIRYPMNGGAREAWAREFATTLENVERRIKQSQMPPMVLLEIAHSISWHAHYGDGRPSKIAKRIIAALPTTLEFRATLALLDGHGMLLRKMGDDYASEMLELEKSHATLADEMRRRFPDPVNLYEFVEGILADIATHDTDRQASPYQFLYVLLNGPPDLADLVITRALRSKDGQARNYTHLAVAALLGQSRTRALSLIGDLLKSGDPHLQAAVGYAYGVSDFKTPPSKVDIDNIRALLTADEPQLVWSGLSALRALRAHPRLLIDLLCVCNFGSSARLANHALMLLQLDRQALYAQLTEHDVAAILERLQPLDELEGHWIEEFLAFASRAHGWHCAKFFMARVEHAARTENWRHRPCNHGPYGHVPLRFRESPEVGTILIHVSTWMSSKPSAPFLFGMRAAELFSTMFVQFDGAVISHLGQWMQTADSAGLLTIARVLREGPNDLIFRELDFTLRLLKRSKQLGNETYRLVCGELYAAAISGMRSGTPGVPFQQDLQLRDNARSALASLPRFSPGHDLFQDLERHAEDSIKRSRKEGEAFDDE